jgi:hypothetical protein
VGEACESTAKTIHGGYRRAMVGLDAGLWGLFGGFAVEGLELYTAWRRYGRWPWNSPDSSEAGPWGYAVAEVVRLLIGAGLAWAAAATGQISGPLGALGVGAAAPTIIGQMARTIPLELPQPAATVETHLPVNGHVRDHPSLHQVQPARVEPSEPEVAMEGEG